MTREELIAEMEEHSRQALERLREYQELEQDYKRTVKALKVLRGEKMTAANGDTPRKPRKKQGKRGATKAAVLTLLKANPKGLALSQLQQKLKENAGLNLSRSAIYAALPQQVEGVLIPGTQAKIYRL